MFYEPEVTQRPLVREIVRFKLVVLSQLQVQTRFRVEGLGFIGFTLQTRELFSASKDLIEKIRGLLGPHKKGPFGTPKKKKWSTSWAPRILRLTLHTTSALPHVHRSSINQWNSLFPQMPKTLKFKAFNTHASSRSSPLIPRIIIPNS
jgi:hypothetical protein